MTFRTNRNDIAKRRMPPEKKGETRVSGWMNGNSQTRSMSTNYGLSMVWCGVWTGIVAGHNLSSSFPIGSQPSSGSNPAQRDHNK